MADIIGVGQHHRAQRGHDEAPIDSLAPVAHVADAAIAEREDAPFLVRRDFEIVDLVPLLTDRHQVLFAGLDPAHRPAELARKVTDHDMLTVERRLHPEAAALVARRDDPDLGSGEFQEIGKGEALDVGALRRQMDGEPVSLAPGRERAPSLDGADAAALGAEALLEHHLGLGEQRVDLSIVLGDLVWIEAAGVARGEDLVVVPIVIDARGVFA